MNQDLTEAETNIVAIIKDSDPLDLNLKYLAGKRGVKVSSIKKQMQTIYRKLDFQQGADNKKLIRFALWLQTPNN